MNKDMPLHKTYLNNQFFNFQINCKYIFSFCSVDDQFICSQMWSGTQFNESDYIIVTW